jgi:photosystem II stability/assembly factor-like uncharacterized protein
MHDEHALTRRTVEVELLAGAAPGGGWRARWRTLSALQTTLMVAMLCLAGLQCALLTFAAATVGKAGFQITASVFGGFGLIASCIVTLTLLSHPRPRLVSVWLILLTLANVLAAIAVEFDLWALLTGIIGAALLTAASLLGSRRAGKRPPWIVLALGLTCAVICSLLLIFELPNRPLTREPITVAFSTPSRGFAVDSEGIVFASSNGGLTWTENVLLSGRHIAWISFLDSMNGWAYGSDGALLASADGGLTWASRSAVPGGRLSDAMFVDSEHGWSLAQDGTIAATSDGGVRWHVVRNPSSAEDFFALAFGDTRSGWALGLSGNDVFASRKGMVLHTDDGGRHWDVQSLAVASGDPTAIAANGPNNAWAVGADGLIVATTDGGVTWARQEAGTSKDLLSVCFLDAEHGWAAGTGVILRTSDGGRHWAVRQSETVVDLHHITFVDTHQGWASGDGGTIVATSDGGRTWSVQLTGTKWR